MEEKMTEEPGLSKSLNLSEEQDYSRDLNLSGRPEFSKGSALFKGLDIVRSYFEEYGLPMLQAEFSEILPFIAAGLFGSGSECFGYDDGISRDHDFEPGFCLMLPGEEIVDRRTAFLLERACSKLPREYMGLKRSIPGPVGGPRRGVIRLADFLMDKTGTPDGLLTRGQWLALPQHSLSELVNGEVFLDNYGELTRIRQIFSFYPEDIRKKKLAGHLLLMGQSGQYNYRRCLMHGEEAAAQMAVFEYVKSTMSVLFLLNRRYQPYYKWGFRALRALPLQAWQAELLEFLITSHNEENMAEEKYQVIEGIASDVIEELSRQELTRAVCGDLEKHAYSVNDSIEDPELRNMHILAGVNDT